MTFSVGTVPRAKREIVTMRQRGQKRRFERFYWGVEWEVFLCSSVPTEYLPRNSAARTPAPRQSTTIGWSMGKYGNGVVVDCGANLKLMQKTRESQKMNTSEPRKQRKSRPHWYEQHIDECALCGSQDRYRVRVYGPKPQNPEERYFFEQFACPHHFL